MAKNQACGMYVRLLLAAIALLCPAMTFADYERGMGPGMMGGQGMMGPGYGHHMGGLWFLGFGLYALLCLAGAIIFFWLMFRITCAGGHGKGKRRRENLNLFIHSLHRLHENKESVNA